MAQVPSASSSFKDSSLSSASPGGAISAVLPDAKTARDPRGHFTDAFKVAAVRYAGTSGKSQRAAALDMGISDKTLSGWINDARPDAAGIVDVQRFDELSQLRSQNRELHGTIANADMVPSATSAPKRSRRNRTEPNRDAPVFVGKITPRMVGTPDLRN